METKERIEELLFKVQSKTLLVWDFFRRGIPAAIRNLWTFRKAIWRYRWYSGDHGVLILMETAVRDIEKKKGKWGYEAESTALLSRAKMRRAADLMKRVIEDEFIDLAEKELGIELTGFESVPSKNTTGAYEYVFKENDALIFEKAREIEDATWKELWEIIKGTGAKEYDGTDLRSWWD
jgi:hypothetical protein